MNVFFKSPAVDFGSTRNSTTFPHGFLDFLKVGPGRRHRVGDYELDPRRLEDFNRVLRALSPEAPALTLDQIASAANRALGKHVDGSMPPFVASRMQSMERLEALSEDSGFAPSAELRRQVRILRAYRMDHAGLIPDRIPVIGLLDDAVLVDVALQLLRDELADYEDFCRFRKVAADFAGIAEADTGLTREQWLEAMLQAHRPRDNSGLSPHGRRYIADPRASLFHVV